MPDLSSVGERIRFIRNRRNMTLEQLAERAEVSKSYLWEVERGRSNMTGEKLVRVANVLGASLDFIMVGKTSEDLQPQTIEIPRELGDFAEEQGLTYREIMALLDIDRSILARRSDGPVGEKSKEDWRRLFAGVEEFIKEEH